MPKNTPGKITGMPKPPFPTPRRKPIPDLVVPTIESPGFAKNPDQHTTSHAIETAVNVSKSLLKQPKS